MSVLSLIPEERKKCLPSTESVYSANSLKLSCALHKKKIFHPLLSTSTMLTMSHGNSNRGGSGDKYVAKRVLSAKEHRLKHLQNQLADAHFHLSELSNENRLLRNLQKRQDSALQRYENSNGDIPKLINGHTEEIRAWQTRYKQLRLQFRDVTQKLKEKDLEYQQLHDEHKHLLELSKDANLREREKLQNQVYDLTDKVKSQTDIINTLQRRITLETKNHKHQLNVEISKHKTTQENLTEAIKNGERLTAIIETKEKIISSTATKRLLPKINLAMGSKITDMCSSADVSAKSNNPLVVDLSVNGSSISDSQSSSDRASKSKLSTKTMCTIVDKLKQKNIIQDRHTSDNVVLDSANFRSSKVQSPLDNSTDLSRDSSAYFNDMSDYGLAKAIRDGMPNLRMFESDTDLPKSSDDEVKDRVEMMKQQLKQMHTDDRKKHGIDKASEKNNMHTNNNYHSDKAISNFSVVSEDSSPDETFNQQEKRQPKKNRRNVKDSVQNDLDEQLKLADQGSYNISDLARSLIDVEANNAIESKDIDNVLQNYCNEIISSQENNIANNQSNQNASFPNPNDHLLDEISIKDNAKKQNVEEGYLKSFSSEKSDNTKLSSGKNVELNDDKKKKLLAALKAIDRGDDDGLNLNGLKKHKTPAQHKTSHNKNYLK